MRALYCIFLTMMSGAGFAQTTGSVYPSVVPAEPSVKEDAPPGGCMPIGLTASGEIVFPFQCKEFIEQHRGKDVEQKPPVVEDKHSAVEQKPAAAEEKPAAAEQRPVTVEEPAVKQSTAEGPDNTQSINKPAKTVSLLKRVEQNVRYTGSEGCQHYQTYDPKSGNYTGYDKRRHSCR